MRKKIRAMIVWFAPLATSLTMTDAVAHARATRFIMCRRARPATPGRTERPAQAIDVSNVLKFVRRGRAIKPAGLPVHHTNALSPS